MQEKEKRVPIILFKDDRPRLLQPEKIGAKELRSRIIMPASAAGVMPAAASFAVRMIHEVSKYSISNIVIYPSAGELYLCHRFVNTESGDLSSVIYRIIQLRIETKKPGLQKELFHSAA